MKSLPSVLEWPVRDKKHSSYGFMHTDKMT